MDLNPQPNAALARGLKVLEYVSLQAGPVRYSAISAQLSGINDSTLSRLLRSLESLGYLIRETDGYTLGAAWKRWQTLLQSKPLNDAEVFERMVLDLVCRTNESAGVALLMEDRLVVVASRTAREGVSIIGEGDVLHFEADHAASMAVLDSLPESARLACLDSPYSRMADRDAYVAGREALHEENGVFLDRSLTRPGICRMAVCFERGAVYGSLFLCMTRERAEAGFSELAACLRSMVA